MNEKSPYEIIHEAFMKPFIDKSIFILEDEKVIALDLRRRINKQGFTNVTSFDRPEDALEEAVKHKPDLVITDDTMYGPMDGPEALFEFKKRYNIPVIGLGTMYIEWWIQNSKGYFMDFYLFKPFKENELMSNILYIMYKYYSSEITVVSKN